MGALQQEHDSQPVIEHGYAGLGDWQEILEFMCRVRAEQPHCDHVGDLLWADRVPTADPEKNICLWRDEAGNLAAFSLVHTHWGTLQYEVKPSLRSRTLEGRVLSRGVERLAAAAARAGEPDWSVYASSPEDDAQRLELLEEAGFERASTYAWHLIRPLPDTLPEPVLPPGFRIRPIAGEDEAPAYVDAHRDAWQPRSTMTVELHLRLMRMPMYRRELNLVVTAPDGTLAAAMIGWLDPLNKTVEIEPLGVRPRFRRMGLGRAIVVEGLHRFRAVGAEAAEVWGVSRKPEAVDLYQSAGFEKSARVLDLVKKIPTAR